MAPFDGGLPKDNRFKGEASEKPIENVAGFLTRVEEYACSAEAGNYILAYRGEPKLYPTYCRPGIFRKPELMENPYFEKNLFDAMRQNRLTGEKSYLENAIDAQHGEFPSRLLDVSYNCLTALYFAVTPFYQLPEDCYDDQDGMVFLFFIDELFSPTAQNIRENYEAIVNRSPGWCQEPIFQKNHKFLDHMKLNPRIIAQQGAFILFQGDEPEDLPPCMYCGIPIPGAAKKAIRGELKRFFGIHTGSIYPEISNLVKELTNRSGYLNAKPYSMGNELSLVLEKLRRELDFYLEYALSQKEEGNEASLWKILAKAERVADSYRRGFIHLIQGKKGHELLWEMEQAVTGFNRQMEEFSDKLAKCGLGKFRWERLAISIAPAPKNSVEKE